MLHEIEGFYRKACGARKLLRKEWFSSGKVAFPLEVRAEGLKADYYLIFF